MMVFIGLVLILPVILIILKATNIKTNRVFKILLNISLLIISLLFIITCFLIPSEPFDYNISEPLDYILYSSIIYLFSPFMWIITFYYSRNIIKKLRVRKNSKLKGDIKYYRDDLDKIEPNIIMFTSLYDVDYKKSISSTILKLKIMGYIEEKNKKFIITNKDTSLLLESEKMVLDLIKTNELDKSKYHNTIEKETIEKKYVKKNSNVFFTIIKIVLVILLNISMYKASIKLDDYVFDNYHIMSEKIDNKRYIHLERKEDIEKIYNESKDNSIFYKSIIFGEDSYNYTLVRDDALEYSVVRKAVLLNISVPISIFICIMSSFIVFYIVIDLLININKKYRRTLKGKELLNKAYALKNYLKDFTLIKNRKEKELILWNYYLVYATTLGVNIKINDEVINKYVR